MGKISRYQISQIHRAAVRASGFDLDDPNRRHHVSNPTAIKILGAKTQSIDLRTKLLLKGREFVGRVLGRAIVIALFGLTSYDLAAADSDITYESPPYGIKTSPPKPKPASGSTLPPSATVHSPKCGRTVWSANGSCPIIFSASQARPTASEWRDALHHALGTLLIHECAQGFVPSKNQTTCPWCNKQIDAQIFVAPRDEPSITLKITVPSSQRRFSMALSEGKTITLGRTNLGSPSRAISTRHLEITRFRNKLYLRHVGRNRALIKQDNKWYQLQETWLEYDDLRSHPLSLQIADAEIKISIIFVLAW